MQPLPGGSSSGLQTDAKGLDRFSVGAGHNGLSSAARLQALGVKVLVIDREQRIGDNWRLRYEALSLHFPHWADHLAYMPFPPNWPVRVISSLCGVAEAD